MLGAAFAAVADGRTSSDLAEARIGTRRPRRRVARLARRLLVERPHGRMPLLPPPAACSCRFRSRLATWPDTGARRRQSSPPADDTRRCTTARRFGLPPGSARWKRQLLETRGARHRQRQELRQFERDPSSRNPRVFRELTASRTKPTCGISPAGAENPAPQACAHAQRQVGRAESWPRRSSLRPADPVMRLRRSYEVDRRLPSLSRPGIQANSTIRHAHCVSSGTHARAQRNSIANAWLAGLVGISCSPTRPAGLGAGERRCRNGSESRNAARRVCSQCSLCSGSCRIPRARRPQRCISTASRAIPSGRALNGSSRWPTERSPLQKFRGRRECFRDRAGLQFLVDWRFFRRWKRSARARHI